MQRNRLITPGVAIIAALVVLVIAVSGGSAKTARPQAGGATALAVKQTPLGATLVDANGRALYLFQGDKPGVSMLSTAGLAVWPAFTSTATPRVGGAANAALIGVSTQANGSRQVTYNGHPLYYYVGDRQPGSTNGQGLNQFGALWYVLSPSGDAVTTAQSTAAAAPPAPSGYGY